MSVNSSLSKRQHFLSAPLVKSTPSDRRIGGHRSALYIDADRASRIQATEGKKKENIYNIATLSYYQEQHGKVQQPKRRKREEEEDLIPRQHLARSSERSLAG